MLVFPRNFYGSAVTQVVLYRQDAPVEGTGSSVFFKVSFCSPLRRGGRAGTGEGAGPGPGRHGVMPLRCRGRL